MAGRLALLDWDGSLHAGFTIVAWARFLAEGGIFDSGAADAMAGLVGEYDTGQVPYRVLSESLPSLYAAGLAGRRHDDVHRAAETFVAVDAGRLFGFTRWLLAALRAAELRTVVVSGCPVEPLLAYRRMLLLDDVQALTVATGADGIYVDGLALDPATAEGKAAVVDALGPVPVAVAVGDSGTDLPLLAAAELRIVVDNPSLLAGEPRVCHISSTPSHAELSMIADGLRALGPGRPEARPVRVS